MSADSVLIEAEEDARGERLDRFLAARLPELTRSRAQALIREGRVRENGRPIDEPSYRVKPGRRYRVELPPPEPPAPEAETRPLTVLYEDAHLLVVVKPAGMVVHPAAGHARGTLVNALLAHCGESLSGIGGVARPGIVHRLDKDVSGVMVVAKHDRAHLGLAAQFTLHSIERVYEALVWGLPHPTRGRIDAPIARDPRDRKRMAVVEGGKHAVTHYRVVEAAGILAARLELRLETGRTHQIRVHLHHIGHPVLGDPLYRPRRRPKLHPPLKDRLAAPGRLLLHARRLAFTHPILDRPLCFEAPPPALFDELLQALREAAHS